jgi:hypothetical protein
MDVASQFNTLLKNLNTITDVISPQLRSAFNYADDVLDTFVDFFRAKNSDQPLENIVNFFVELDNRLETIDDPGIVKGWMQQFAALPQNIIDEVIGRLGGEAKFLLRNFSDSIAEITRPQNYRDDSTLPPVNIPDTLQDVIDTGMKIPAYLEQNLNELGQITKQLINKNLSGVVGEVATSAISHGANLVADALHLNRFTGIITDYMSSATETFLGASNFVRQVINYSPFAGSNVAAPVLQLVEKAEGLVVSLNSVGRDVINLPEKAISLLQNPRF